jgi:hypothetical protein
MKAAIDVLEQPSRQLVEETITSDENDLSEAQDDYGVDDDAISSIKKEELSSEEEEPETIPVKLKRPAPTITEQQNPERHQVQAQVEKLRVHYKRQKLEGDGNLGIVSLMKPVPKEEIDAMIKDSEKYAEEDKAIKAMPLVEDQISSISTK